MTQNKIRTIAEEAAKLLKENPEWSYKKAIQEVKKVYGLNK